VVANPPAYSQMKFDVLASFSTLTGQPPEHPVVERQLHHLPAACAARKPSAPCRTKLPAT
jgi:hypothetical protein